MRRRSGPPSGHFSDSLVPEGRWSASAGNNLGGSDLARAYAMQLACANGARAGAESAVIGFNLTDAAIIQHVRDEMARTPGMDPYSASTTITVTHIVGPPAYTALPTLVQ